MLLRRGKAEQVEKRWWLVAKLRYVHPGTCTYALPTLIAILAGRRNLNHLAAIIIGDAAALEDDDEEETEHQMELYYFFFLVKGWAVQGTMNLTCRSP